MAELLFNDLILTLQQRFNQNMQRHPHLDWKKVEIKLKANPSKLQVLDNMERTGGEPDVVIFNRQDSDIIFCDCSAESPKERRSLCYDAQALASRKANKPDGSALEMALSIGVEILTDAQYRQLQQVGEFDKKTSSWLKTPVAIRSFGGAIFGDRRYDHVFIYHNGAESYYAARGFRGWLAI